MNSSKSLHQQNLFEMIRNKQLKFEHEGFQDQQNPLEFPSPFKTQQELSKILKEEIYEIIFDRQDQCVQEFHRRYDMKDLIFYTYQSYESSQIYQNLSQNQVGGQMTQSRQLTNVETQDGRRFAQPILRFNTFVPANQISTSAVPHRRNVNPANIQQRENKTLIGYLNKVGGRLKFTVNEGVNVIIIEPEQISRIIEDFCKWRDNLVSFYGDQSEKQVLPISIQPEVANAQNISQQIPVIDQNRYLPKNKREQKLLGQNQQLKSGNLAQKKQINQTLTETSNVPQKFKKIDQDQRSISNKPIAQQDQFEETKKKDKENQQKLRQASLEDSFNSSLILGDKFKQNAQTYRSKNQNVEIKLLRALKQLSDDQKRDFEILKTIIYDKNIMVTGFDLMYITVSKFTCFTADFQKRKKIPVHDSQLQNTIALTCRNGKELMSKQHFYQCHHTFETKILSTSQAQYSTGVLSQVSQVKLIPTFRPDAPIGSCLFLDDEDYKQIMREKNEKVAIYRRHLQRLNEKKPDYYEIKTPLPNNTDKCFVCEGTIQEENYKAHLKSDLHKESVQNNKLYGMIDSLIDEMNEETKNGKQKRRGGRRKKQNPSNVDLNLISDSEDNLQSGGRLQGVSNLNLTQDSHLFTAMSTEITMAQLNQKQRNKIMKNQNIQEILHEQKKLQTMKQNAFMQGVPVKSMFNPHNQPHVNRGDEEMKYLEPKQTAKVNLQQVQKRKRHELNDQVELGHQVSAQDFQYQKNIKERQLAMNDPVQKIQARENEIQNLGDGNQFEALESRKYYTLNTKTRLQQRELQKQQQQQWISDQQENFKDNQQQNNQGFMM
eukprot:403376017